MMFETICDECKSKPAYRRILETKDGVKRYIYVCRDCYYNKQKNATIKLMDNIAIKTITPTQEWQDCYRRVKEELTKLGLDFVQGPYD